MSIKPKNTKLTYAKESFKNFLSVFFLLFFGFSGLAQKKFEEDLSAVRLRYRYQKPNVLPAIILEDKILYPNKLKDITAALNDFLDRKFIGKPAQVQGYRLMIFSDKDREKAENAKKKAMQVFSNEQVILVFERPNYRIKVGEYLNKEDADEAKKQALKHFSEVIVVPDWIKIVRLSQSKPD
ncbi:MAG: SPOR domain-containing protein [Raineya sp.]